MKVNQLLETDDWENSPIVDRTYISVLRKKLLAVQHHRELIVQKLLKDFNLDYSYVEKFLEPWHTKNRPLEHFPADHRNYIKAIKKVDVDIDKMKDIQSRAMRNMKYAKHDAHLALTHARAVGHAYPHGEDAIASNAETAFRYATEVIKKRFPKGELTIAASPEFRHQYVMKFGKIAK